MAAASDGGLGCVAGAGGAAVRAWDDVGVGVRVAVFSQERVVDGLVRVRCVAVQRVRLAGERVVERGCEICITPACPQPPSGVIR